MSLRIWLPLTKDLRNQGLDDVIVTNNGATYSSTDGKLGGCYSFDGSDDFISLNSSALYDIIKGGATPFSITMWVYHADATRAILFGDYGLTGINFNIELNASHSVRFYWNGSPATSGGHTLATLSTWTHIAVIYDGTKIDFYMNGELKDTYIGTLATRTKTSGMYYIGRDYRTGSTAFNGRLSDFRIYDHALSQMEVKQISQGLVLHYPLDKNSTYTSLVDKTANYTIYNNFSVPASLTATGEQYLGSPVRRLSMTPDSDHLSNFKTSLGSHGVYGWRQTFAASTKYVFWIYYKPISHMDVRVGGTASNISGWTEIPPKAVGDGWYVVGQYRNGTVTEAKTDNIFVSFYSPSAQADVPIQIDFACPTLIQGLDEMQPSVNWSSGSIIYDNSGFCNNGVINNTLSTTEDTPKYSVSTNFSGTSYVSLVPPTSEVLTIAVWANWKTIPSGQSVILVDNGSGIGLGLMNTGILCSTSKAGNSYTFSKANLVANTWYHFVVVKTGTTTPKLYINGVEQTTTSHTSKWTFAINELQLGKRSTTSDGFAGKLCDFRAYTTALSADDVKSLYQNCATIDPDGTIRGQIRS